MKDQPPAILIQLRRDHALGRTMPPPNDLYHSRAKAVRLPIEGSDVAELLEYIGKLESLATTLEREK